VTLHRPALAWLPPPAEPRLDPDVVHVWRIPLVLDAGRLRRLWELLSPPERSRAAGFCFEPDRRRFVAAHGRVRTVLAAYLNAPPAALRFERGPWGKPTLADATHDLRFNLSHSGWLALLAVAGGREVGVDVEQGRPEVAVQELAERFFAAEEARRLRELGPGDRRRAFFHLWACKEAYAKAGGRGLGVGLDVPVRTGPGGWLRAGWDGTGQPALLQGLDAGEGYAAAVAAQGTCTYQLALWQYPTGGD
jgi:4'-phosphopantetheinyl transferase